MAEHTARDADVARRREALMAVDAVERQAWTALRAQQEVIRQDRQREEGRGKRSERQRDSVIEGMVFGMLKKVHVCNIVYCSDTA